MTIIVQKFGGTSVSTEESRTRCIEHIQEELNHGHQVVLVVSAMGRNGDPYATDTLLSLLGDSPPIKERELDVLLSSGEMISASLFSNMLEAVGIKNTVLTGGQAGIITDESFGNAKIVDLRPERLLLELEKVPVVVVPGFQGVTHKGDITTLGRGGSDTSATAIGVSLNAAAVDIFTDVEGVMTADPRIVEEAIPLKQMTYTELCNFAHLGAKIIDPRAVEMAMKKNIPIRIRSTFSSDQGTLVHTSGQLEVTERLITGLTQTTQISQISIQFTESGLQAHEILSLIRDEQISIDFINLSNGSLQFTVKNQELEALQTILERAEATFQIERDCVKISIVGAGIQGVPGVMASIAHTLHSQQIPILQTADSHTTIWILTKEPFMKQAICSLHRTFTSSTTPQITSWSALH